MNERIKELAEQSTKKLHGFSYRFGNTTETYFDEEKFAELIVREVLAVQEQLISDGHNAWHLNKPTKEYFGVE